jgi:hypothetical protein
MVKVSELKIPEGVQPIPVKLIGGLMQQEYTSTDIEAIMKENFKVTYRDTIRRIHGELDAALAKQAAARPRSPAATRPGARRDTAWRLHEAAGNTTANPQKRGNLGTVVPLPPSSRRLKNSLSGANRSD